jgi:hypothetical protein
VRLLAGGTPWLGLGRRFLIAAPIAIAITSIAPPVIAAVALLGLLPEHEPMGFSLGTLALAQVGLATFLFGAYRAGAKLAVWPAAFLPVGAVLAIRALVAAYRARFAAGIVDFRGRNIAIDEDPSSLLEKSNQV